MHRWILSAHHRAEFTRQCKQLAARAGRGRKEPLEHEQQLSSESQKDENDVGKVNAFLDCLEVNPFADEAA